MNWTKEQIKSTLKELKSIRGKLIRLLDIIDDWVEDFTMANSDEFCGLIQKLNKAIKERQKDAE